MTARSRMTHRARTVRDVAGGEDPHGQATTSEDEINEALPCYVQPRMERLVLDGDKIAAIANYYMILPIGSDLKERDRVTRVANRRDDTLFSNRMRVLTIVRRENHLEAALEEVA